MRKHVFITTFVVLVLTACNYEEPLVEKALLPIDQALLGTWHSDRDGQESPERIVVRQESANLYEIEYVAPESDFITGGTIYYFKGWLAELKGIRFMQLELTGGDEGEGRVDLECENPDECDLFSVASCALVNGVLVVRFLNTDLVNEDLADTAGLQAAFTANKDDPELFVKAWELRKLPEESVNTSENSEVK